LLTNGEIEKLIHNLDEQKQWSALHYAVANDNLLVVKYLTGLQESDDGHTYHCGRYFGFKINTFFRFIR
jgi:hypothetical protein